MKILVLQLARLGDLVQTWPLLRQLRLAYPGARLGLVADAALSPLVELGPPVEEWWPLDLSTLAALAGQDSYNAYNRIQRLISDLREANYSVIFNLNFSRLSLLLSHLLEAPVRGNLPGAGGREVFREPWLALVFALAHARALNRLHLSDVFRHLAPRPGRVPRQEACSPPGSAPILALQLGTRHPRRTWPLEFFTRLADTAIRELEAEVWLLGTRAERPLGEALSREVPAPRRERVINLQGRTGLKELGARLRQVRLLVSGDTGTLHLAAALGTPTLGLFFGPASCFETGPYGVGHYVLQAEPPCHPCREAGPACVTPFCAAMLPPELVAAVVAARWRGEDDSAEVAPPPGTRLYRSAEDGLGITYEPVEGSRFARDVLGVAYRRAGAGLVGLPPEGGPPLSGSMSPQDREDLDAVLTALRNGLSTAGLPTAAAQALAPLAAFRQTLWQQQQRGWEGQGEFWFERLRAGLREALEAAVCLGERVRN